MPIPYPNVSSIATLVPVFSVWLSSMSYPHSYYLTFWSSELLCIQESFLSKKKVKSHECFILSNYYSKFKKNSNIIKVYEVLYHITAFLTSLQCISIKLAKCVCPSGQHLFFNSISEDQKSVRNLAKHFFFRVFNGDLFYLLARVTNSDDFFCPERSTLSSLRWLLAAIFILLWASSLDWS